jgi:uncharacterized protein YndB with AHSA1/START domain/DNA-binding transcriptional ArsR family regulator
MDALLIALADPARWRLLELLAERPRPVGVLAELAQARQPQTTKHLQTLERAGVVTATRVGQRRIYALRPGPLLALADTLRHLADTATREDGPLAAFERHGHVLQSERAAAAAPGWADGRTLHFRRSLPAAAAEIWRHLTDPALLATWWTPDDLRVSELVFEARPGGRIVQEYRDAEDLTGTDQIAGRATGTVDRAQPGEYLAYRLSPLLPGGEAAFTAYVEMTLTPTGAGTDLDVEYRVTGSTVTSADFIAGIEIGFGQSLDKLTASITASIADPGSLT